MSASTLLSALRAAESWLAVNRDGINAINVYPVPDGDTGTNMLLTLRSSLAACPSEAARDGGMHVGEMLAAAARAALLGARGNSGVILSQMLRGFADSLAGAESAGEEAILAALEGASQAAYAAVSAPVEGTMLTVLREAAAAGRAAEGSPAARWRAVVDEAYVSLARTPDLLPRLRDAGVVDSGGAGIAVLLEGVASGLGHGVLPAQPRFAATETVALDAVEHQGHGYCTEFVVAGDSIDRAALEQALADLGGDSILVVGDQRAVHVHVHLEDPGPALSAGVRAGALLTVKVENMQVQHEAWAAAHEAHEVRAAHGTASNLVGDLPTIGLLAVAQGRGIRRTFRDLGATQIIAPPNGKASPEELLTAARQAGRDHVLVLPNDKDLLMAAQVAARESQGFLTVVPTRDVAAGLAAAVAYLPFGDPQAIAAEMHEVLETVTTVEVTIAVRDALLDGVDCRKGDAIAFVQGRLVATGTAPEDALLAGLAHAVGERAEIVTIYRGEDTSHATGEHVGAMVRAAHPQVTVEVFEGGQPHYHYVASVE